MLNNLFERYEIRRHTSNVSLLYILAENNAGYLIGRYPSNLACFEVEDERYGAPIFAALAAHSGEAVAALLEAQGEIQPPKSPFHNLYKQYCQDGIKRHYFGRDFKFSREIGILYAVLQHGDEVLADTILALDKFDFERRNDKGQTSLGRAAENGHETVVQLLLDRGADIEARNNQNQTPLWEAANCGHEAIVRLLLDRGADIEARDDNGQTPLWRAAATVHQAALQPLLYWGADIEARANTWGRTPLCQAAQNGRVVAARLLLDQGANIEAKDNNGQTPLMLAKDEAVVRLLQSHVPRLCHVFPLPPPTQQLL